MSPDPRTGRASDLLGRTVYDDTGTPIGCIADLITEPTAGGNQRVTAAIVVQGRWGRLLGYERREVSGPWILEHLARLILRRKSRDIPWQQVRFTAREPQLTPVGKTSDTIPKSPS
ncbi:PRC-barrel domain-containing protein [Actinoplanes sp. Pm04-4]|uniref:PRC-barrel domain-containing protein n=1 Tax=Paractinoplanes pyxinae TaxID=2997416 RepID=A0ABT4B537_9ACTN|nr:PRC-barrel domain-containing protein [Actinoplanes pyxinae]MCY1141605.1 PRC-barrel domain-containing protein [Actinoplanes pyxinae]